jgi:hypothetical protein
MDGTGTGSRPMLSFRISNMEYSDSVAMVNVNQSFN